METKHSGSWRMVIVVIIMVLGMYFIYQEIETTAKQKNQSMPNTFGTEQERGMTQSKIMQKYFPLHVGDSWTYKRTLKDPNNVFSFTEKSAISPS